MSRRKARANGMVLVEFLHLRKKNYFNSKLLLYPILSRAWGHKGQQAQS